MQDIKPDTSLYTDLPNKLRAFALFAESNEPAEYQESSGRWVTYNRPGMLDASAQFLANGQHEYRLKPKPRELWKLFCGDAMVERNFTERRYAENFKASAAGLGAYAVVRFVEQPERTSTPN